jgi:hypothetical protein
VHNGLVQETGAMLQMAMKAHYVRRMLEQLRRSPSP